MPVWIFEDKEIELLLHVIESRALTRKDLEPNIGLRARVAEVLNRARPLSGGVPVLPASTRRLRNSTWQGTQNVPCCGTDSVPGGRKRGRNPSRGRLY